MCKVKDWTVICKVCGGKSPREYTINREQAELCKERGLEYIRQIEVKETKLQKQRKAVAERLKARHGQ